MRSAETSSQQATLPSISSVSVLAWSLSLRIQSFTPSCIAFQLARTRLTLGTLGRRREKEYGRPSQASCGACWRPGQKCGGPTTLSPDGLALRCQGGSRVVSAVSRSSRVRLTSLALRQISHTYSGSPPSTLPSFSCISLFISWPSRPSAKGDPPPSSRPSIATGWSCSS